MIEVIMQAGLSALWVSLLVIFMIGLIMYLAIKTEKKTYVDYYGFQRFQPLKPRKKLKAKEEIESQK